MGPSRSDQEQTQKPVQRIRHQPVWNLDHVIRAAAQRWPDPVTQAAIAHVSGTSTMTISNYLTGRNGVTQVALDILGRLCWYFGCSPDVLLPVVPEDLADAVRKKRASLPALDPRVIGRNRAPETPPVPGDIWVINHIPWRTLLYTQAQMGQATGLLRKTVGHLAHGHHLRIDHQTLGLLLDLLKKDKLSYLIEVALAQPAPFLDFDPTGPVTILTPKPAWAVLSTATWNRVLATTRRLGNQPSSNGLDHFSVAVIRFLYDGIRLSLPGIEQPRIGEKVAQALNVGRESIRQLIEGKTYHDVSGNSLPPEVQRFLQSIITSPVLNTLPEDLEKELNLTAPPEPGTTLIEPPAKKLK